MNFTYNRRPMNLTYTHHNEYRNHSLSIGGAYYQTPQVTVEDESLEDEDTSLEEENDIAQPSEVFMEKLLKRIAESDANKRPESEVDIICRHIKESLERDYLKRMRLEQAVNGTRPF